MRSGAPTGASPRRTIRMPRARPRCRGSWRSRPRTSSSSGRPCGADLAAVRGLGVPRRPSPGGRIRIARGPRGGRTGVARALDRRVGDGEQGRRPTRVRRAARPMARRPRAPAVHGPGPTPRAQPPADRPARVRLEADEVAAGGGRRTRPGPTPPRTIQRTRSPSSPAGAVARGMGPPAAPTGRSTRRSTPTPASTARSTSAALGGPRVAARFSTETARASARTRSAQSRLATQVRRSTTLRRGPTRGLGRHGNRSGLSAAVPRAASRRRPSFERSARRTRPPTQACPASAPRRHRPAAWQSLCSAGRLWAWPPQRRSASRAAVAGSPPRAGSCRRPGRGSSRRRS